MSFLPQSEGLMLAGADLADVVHPFFPKDLATHDHPTRYRAGISNSRCRRKIWRFWLRTGAECRATMPAPIQACPQAAERRRPYHLLPLQP